VAAKVVQGGLLSFMNWISLQTGGFATISLFNNNVTISVTTLFGDLDPATFSGYANLPLGGAFTPTWNAGTSTYNMQYQVSIWTNTGGAPSESLYGYFVSLGGRLLWAENFASAVIIPAGLSFAVVPSLNDLNQF
jgi:hypothetical protein